MKQKPAWDTTDGLEGIIDNGSEYLENEYDVTDGNGTVKGLWADYPLPVKTVDKTSKASKASKTATKRTGTKTIVCHPGTGTETVKEVLGYWDADLQIITDRDAAGKVQFDGLMLLGGADISPFFYGETTTYSHARDHNRDIIEWILVRRAIAMHLPVMGICRGHQMLSIACGGSLYQDIYMETGRRHQHYSHPLHAVKLPLKRNMPTDVVNSLHHTAVKTVPPGFDVMALAPDGTVESIWRPGMLGVQFHPELMIDQRPAWGNLFRWFLDGLM
jgi:putative glutamine amidotransferase